MTGRVLVTGGTGKTGSRVVEVLRSSGVIALPAARSDPPGGVRFDWEDPATWPAAVRDVSAIYLVAPPGKWDAAETVVSFVESALEHGIRRSAQEIEKSRGLSFDPCQNVGRRAPIPE